MAGLLGARHDPVFPLDLARALVVAVTARHARRRPCRRARRPRRGGFGSRGARTFQAPAPTRTAPTPAAPIQRSTTPQPGPTAAQNAPRPGIAQAARPGFFSTRGGFLGGLLGAGLLGMLLGYGLFGGLGGLGSILGLLLQVVLVVILARMAFAWLQRRNQPAYAGAGVGPVPGAPLRRDAAGPAYAGRRRRRPRPGATSCAIGQADLDQFERTLGELQAAYGAQDLNALRSLATPEVVDVLAEELRRTSGAAWSTMSPTSGCCRATPPSPGARPGRTTPRWRCASACATGPRIAHRPRRRGRPRPADRGHRDLDLRPPARRPLAGLGDPAGLTSVAAWP